MTVLEKKGANRCELRGRREHKNGENVEMKKKKWGRKKKEKSV